jgi:hypothetical protein
MSVVFGARDCSPYLIDNDPERAMTDDDFELDLSELISAEDFLEYFGIDYVPSVVQINRLHILQRFHDYLGQVDEMPDSVQGQVGALCRSPQHGLPGLRDV